MRQSSPAAKHLTIFIRKGSYFRPSKHRVRSFGRSKITSHKWSIGPSSIRTVMFRKFGLSKLRHLDQGAFLKRTFGRFKITTHNCNFGLSKITFHNRTFERSKITAHKCNFGLPKWTLVQIYKKIPSIWTIRIRNFGSVQMDGSTP